MKEIRTFKTILAVFTGFLVIAACSPSNSEEWKPLFNGENLDGWDIKIRGFELNENHNNTFFVEDGLLKVSYDEYERFDNKFGHIYYEEPFSHYKLRVEYRFVGEQVEGGPGWAYRNNGIMFHSQSPESIEIDQDFPASIEAQLLGGDGESERSNFNVCTPETHVVIDGELRTEHCINSDSDTYHGDQWVEVELHVYGDSIVHHIIENDTVLTYTDLQLSATGEPLEKGYIALQAESHPTEFRKIEILDLSNDY
ncbi:MAG: DUF1080 domain-containing protein [Bacteroidales bacterium]